MELTIFTDGGSINNPGPAAIAFIVYLDGKPTYRFSSQIGFRTNNFAEYTALIKALEWLRANSPKTVSRIVFFSDSNLMVNQLNGLYKVKNALIREFVMKVRILEQEIGIPIVYTHIPREKNQYADKLVKKQLSRSRT